MGQYFKIINKGKHQYLEPFSMPSSERFPSLIKNHLMCRLVTWLVCGSENTTYEQVKEKGFYSQKHMGAWHGDAIDIIGDYDEEALCQTLPSEYEDITVEAMAMLLENDENLLQEFIGWVKQDEEHFRHLAAIGLLEHCSKPMLYQLKVHFGDNWKVRFYTGTPTRTSRS